MIYLLRPWVSVMALWTLTAFFRIRGEYMWRSALIGNVMAEVLLQVIGEIYVVITSRGFYTGTNRYAFLSIIICIWVGIAFNTILTARILLALKRVDETGHSISLRRREGVDSYGGRFGRWILFMFVLVWTYIMSWAFFGNFVEVTATFQG